jgi:hypothetical protein
MGYFGNCWWNVLKIRGCLEPNPLYKAEGPVIKIEYFSSLDKWPNCFTFWKNDKRSSIGFPNEMSWPIE